MNTDRHQYLLGLIHGVAFGIIATVVTTIMVKG